MARLRPMTAALALTGLLGCGAASTGSDHAEGAEPASPGRCPPEGVALQVLGSGGPIADDARASSAYLVRVDGRARVLVDAGGGAFLRFAQAGADIEHLRAVLLTHLHVDHSVDLPALLKSASFGSRRDPLPLVGPSGSDRFPPLEKWLRAELGEGGAYGYLAGLTGEGQPFRLQPTEVDVSASSAREVLQTEEIRVEAVGVPHGIVPALGYAVSVRDTRIVLTGDQRMDEERFATMAEGADLLVAHHAIPQGAGEAARALHATPEAIGRLAASTQAGHLILSHHMARSLAEREDGVQQIRERYDGPLTFAADLDCVEAPRGP